MHTLQTLQLLGLDPASQSARRAIALVAENGRWEHAGQRYFDGEVEPCINGRTIEAGAYFGVTVVASAACSAARARASLPTPAISTSRSRATGTTTCSGRSTTSDGPARKPTRIAEAIELVRSKRQADGRWLLERIHPGQVHFDLEGGVGSPSRWNTLRALRVLGWWDRTT